ncbi:Uncharacterised protein [Vibrio cholerae]|nr:Uncharacterised protein [Vibrio cholerae]
MIRSSVVIAARHVICAPAASAAVVVVIVALTHSACVKVGLPLLRWPWVK